MRRLYVTKISESEREENTRMKQMLTTRWHWKLGKILPLPRHENGRE
jgi:hypothetical protein